MPPSRSCLKPLGADAQPGRRRAHGAVLPGWVPAADGAEICPDRGILLTKRLAPQGARLPNSRARGLGVGSVLPDPVPNVWPRVVSCRLNLALGVPQVVILTRMLVSDIPNGETEGIWLPMLTLSGQVLQPRWLSAHGPEEMLGGLVRAGCSERVPGAAVSSFPSDGLPHAEMR